MSLFSDIQGILADVTAAIVPDGVAVFTLPDASLVTITNVFQDRESLRSLAGSARTGNTGGAWSTCTEAISYVPPVGHTPVDPGGLVVWAGITWRVLERSETKPDGVSSLLVTFGLVGGT